MGQKYRYSYLTDGYLPERWSQLNSSSHGSKGAGLLTNSAQYMYVWHNWQHGRPTLYFAEVSTTQNSPLDFAKKHHHYKKPVPSFPDMMGPSLLSYLSVAAIFLQFSPTALADDDDCQPSQWGKSARGLNVKAIEVGQINCRYETTTGPKVYSHSCTSIATKYGITIEQLVDLNPDLDKGCKSIQPETTYCVKGCEFVLSYISFLICRTCS